MRNEPLFSYLMSFTFMIWRESFIYIYSWRTTPNPLFTSTIVDFVLNYKPIERKHIDQTGLQLSRLYELLKFRFIFLPSCASSLIIEIQSPRMRTKEKKIGGSRGEFRAVKTIVVTFSIYLHIIVLSIYHSYISSKSTMLWLLVYVIIWLCFIRNIRCKLQQVFAFVPSDTVYNCTFTLWKFLLAFICILFLLSKPHSSHSAFVWNWLSTQTGCHERFHVAHSIASAIATTRCVRMCVCACKHLKW